ncbi:MAG: hypothetical protein F2793_06160 [Actinobacteria bacterium]|uniref:Unannotated protein n=1 Tax=freshwater metagenome TaxID=449393 RepID=A0A6J7EKC4_9ZZZZ|nr:hypothetical protein [Actinomycetota bacterium]
MRTRLKLLTIGLVLVTASAAGCSSTTAGSAGAAQDDVSSSAPASAATDASSSASAAAAPETGAEEQEIGANPEPGDLGKKVTAPPLIAPSQSCTTPIADNAWTSSPSLGPNGSSAQTYPYYIEVPVGSACTNFVWISTTVSPASGGGTALVSPTGSSLPNTTCLPDCMANPMTSMKIPAHNNQEAFYYSGGVGTTVFQIQDSTGTLGGTYTVNVVAQ